MMDRSMLAAVVPVHLPAAFAQLCVARGIPAAQLLQGVDFDAADLLCASTRFSYAQIRRMVENALKLSGDPSLGVTFGLHMRLSRLGSVGVALMCAPTLRHAMQVIDRFHALLGPAIWMQADLAQERVAIHFRKNAPLGLTHSFTQEVMSVGIVCILRDLMGAPLADLQLSYDYPQPSYVAAFAPLQVRIRWEQAECAVSLPLTLVDNPLPRGDQLAFDQAWLRCEAELAEIRADAGTWLMQVKVILLRDLHATITAEQLAEQLHLSRRSLFRKLAEQQTSFAELLTAVRMQVAEDYLRRTGIGLAELALVLGYSDASNFSKAFKGWYGVTPKRWRDGAGD
jgi:AraC-like DNA-binding protein